MDGEIIYKLVLNGVPLREFLILYGWGLLGSFSFFLFSLYKSLQFDKRTPKAFHWKYFWMGAIRVFLTLVFMALGIVFWDKVSHLIFNVEGAVELNGWSAFLSGTLIDRLMEGVLGGGKDAGEYVGKKLKNGKQ